MNNNNKASSTSTLSADEVEVNNIRKAKVKEIFSKLVSQKKKKLNETMCNKCDFKHNQFDRWVDEGQITNTFNLGPHRTDNSNIIKISHLCQHTTKSDIYICLKCDRFTINARGPSRITHTEHCSQSKAKPDVNTQSVFSGGDNDDDDDDDDDDDIHCDGNFDGDDDVHVDDRTPIREGLESPNGDVIKYIKDTFNKPTANYLEREHHKEGDGNRGLVVRARVNNDIGAAYELHCTDECVARELQSAKMYLKADKNMRHDIAASNHNIVKEFEEEKEELIEEFKQSMRKAGEELLAKMTSTLLKDEEQGQEKKSIMAKTVQDVVDTNIESMTIWRSSSKDRKIDPITDPNTIRTQITEGPNSIIKNLPLPHVKELGSFSYIPIKDVIELTFALGLPVRQYKGDEDWLHNEKYEGKYYEDLHKKVQNDSRNSRRCILRCWSDGFQAFAVKENNKKKNSLQIVTVTLLGKDGQNITWPFALGFKTDDMSNVIDELRCEAKKLEEPFVVYCGIEKRLIQISVHLQVIMNDHPERCVNSCTSANGRFTHRWEYSCLYCHETTPSCQICRSIRVNRILAAKPSRDQEEVTYCLVSLYITKSSITLYTFYFINIILDTVKCR